MHLRPIIIILLLSSTFLGAQIDEDFNLNGINELVGWDGDLNNFIINDQQQLQLNAAEGGESTIYAPLSADGNVEWEFYFKINFAPSTSNQLRIYLFADAKEISTSNGYYIEVGESGTNDNIKVYRQDSGRDRLIAQGMMSTLGSDPAEAKVVIKRADDGLWSLSAAYGGNDMVQLEVEFFDDTHQVGSGYFGINCSYTSTRADKFLFDNIYAGIQRADLVAPQLIDARVLDPSRVRLLFDELMDETTATNLNNFEINNNIGNPKSITLGEFNNEIILELNNPLLEGEVYELSLSDLTDLAGNEFSTTAELFLVSIPQRGDLVINEILFDPYRDSEDFVELYNTTSKYLDMNSVVIANQDNEQQRMLTTNKVLKPFDYLAITVNKESLSNYYVIKAPDNIIQNGLPAFNNDDGNVSVYLSLEGELLELVDTYNYRDDNHSPWIDDTEGVSLERINPDDPSDEEDNWQSASSASGFATPGYVNSNFSDQIITNDEFLLEKKTFSPDGDGFDDFLRVNYRVSKPGFVLNMRVFDDRGHFVKTLANNEILGSNGTVLWNGENEQGTMAGLGIYIIFLEYFNTDGSLQQKKLSCVLAKQLN